MKYRAKRKTPIMFHSTDYVYREGEILELKPEDFEPLTDTPEQLMNGKLHGYLPINTDAKFGDAATFNQPTQEIEPPNEIIQLEGRRFVFTTKFKTWMEQITAAVNALQKGER